MPGTSAVEAGLREFLQLRGVREEGMYGGERVAVGHARSDEAVRGVKGRVWEGRMADWAW